MPRQRQYETDAGRQAAHRTRRVKREEALKRVVQEAVRLCEAQGLSYDTYDEVVASLQKLLPRSIP